MRFCKRCGDRLPFGGRFCPGCGEAVEGPGEAALIDSWVPPRLPVKMGVLLVVLGLLAAVDVAAFAAAGGWAPAAGALVKLALLAGLLLGSEGARTLAASLAALGLLVPVVVASRLAVERLAPAPLAAAALAVDLAWPAFTLWCLSRRDVRAWLFGRSPAGRALAA